MPGHWVVQDRDGRTIYMTAERWRHALEHDEMTDDLLDRVLLTLKTGRRRQDPANPRVYLYYRPFDDLPMGNQVLCVVVKFDLRQGAAGDWLPNNFVLTAFTS